MFPLSKKEKLEIKKLKDMSDGQKMIELTDYEDQVMRDTIDLLCDREVLLAVNADTKNWYYVRGDFNAFERWAEDQELKAKKLNRREWIIALVSTIIGAFIGRLPEIFNAISQLWFRLGS